MTRPTVRRPRAGATPARRRRPVVPTARTSARDVVGVAHVAAGAVAVCVALFAFVMTAEYGTAGERVGAGVTLLLGAGLAAAGLWIRDGQRRGAVLAAALDGLRVLAVALAYPRGSGPDLVLSLLLLGGVVWLWPTLAAGAAPAGERA
jgi:hypothetical protein